MPGPAELSGVKKVKQGLHKFIKQGGKRIYTAPGRRELDVIAEHALILGVMGGIKQNGNKDERKADGPIA